MLMNVWVNVIFKNVNKFTKKPKKMQLTLWAEQKSIRNTQLL